MSEPSTLVHATCIALAGGRGWLGLLLLAPSGAGKSDLALRLIDGGARLVADDQTLLSRRGEALLASAPATTEGLIEARGIGLLTLPAANRLEQVQAVAAVELVPQEAIERMPDPATLPFLGTALPRWQVAPFEPSAPAKLRLALAALAEVDGKALPQTGQTLSQPQETAAGRRPTVLVTGLSGAGRATALKALEDLGYVAVDNMPLPLLDTVLRADTGPAGSTRAAAFGIDVRTWGFDTHALVAHLDAWRRREDLALRVVFLDCDSDVLLRRYTESRRPHPLARDRPVADGIADERKQLSALRDAADRTIDTSVLSPHELKRILAGEFTLDDAKRLRISIVSFAFGRGLPREADLVLDVRFLRNPHYVTELRALDGRDQPVRDFVAAAPGWVGFMERLEALLAELLPRYDAEGKSYLTIAIGCTGGRHRSVAVADELAGRLARRGRDVATSHRDLGVARDTGLASTVQDAANSAAAMPTPLSVPRTTVPEGI